MNTEKQQQQNHNGNYIYQVRSMKRSSQKVKIFPTIPEQKIQKVSNDPSKVSVLQNPTNDSSLNNEQGMVKCFNCLNNERAICQLTIESGFQKKKNAKYLKIINAKNQKEKQLHKAYGQIVNQLRKKIIEKIVQIPNKFQQSKYQKAEQEIVRLKQQNLKLSIELEAIKKQYFQLYNRQQIQLVQMDRNNKSKIFEHEGRKQRKCKMDYCYRNCELNINNQIIKPKQANLKQIASIPNRQAKEQPSQESSCILIKQQNNRQSSLQQQVEKQYIQIQENQQCFNTVHEISQGGFQSCDKQASSQIPQRKKDNKFGIQYIKQSDLKYLLDSSQFYSVQDNDFQQISEVSQYKQDEKYVRNSYQDLIEFLSPSSKVQKISSYAQTQEESSKQRKQIFSPNIKQPISGTLLFCSFIGKFQEKLEKLSKKFEIAQEVNKNLTKIEFNALHPIQQSQIQQYINCLIQIVQKILRIQRKHYLKKLNDKHLTQSDFSSQIKWLEKEKEKLQRMITTHELNKHILQSKIYDLQEKSGSIIMNTASVIRNKFIKDNYRNKVKGVSVQQMAESIELSSTQDRTDNSLKEALDFMIRQLCTYFSSHDTIIELDYTLDLKIQIKDFLNKLFLVSKTNYELEKGNNQRTLHEMIKKRQQAEKNNINLLSQIKQHKKIAFQKKQNSIDLSSHKSSNAVNEEEQIIALSSSPKYMQASQTSFVQFSSKKVFNNLHSDKQQEIKQLKNILSEYEQQLKVHRADKKKKKVLYLNH